LPAVDSGPGGQLADHLVGRRGHGLLKLPEPVGSAVGMKNAGQDVVAQGGLRVQSRGEGRFLAGPQVQEHGDQGGRADIHGHGEPLGLGVARLEVQERGRLRPGGTVEHERAAELGLAQEPRQAAEHVQVDVHREKGVRNRFLT